jgi:NitT/TauT family transport system ATP-binding protein
MTYALSFDRVSLVFPNGVSALDNFTLDIKAGEVVSIVGPSGSGKSTLLNVAAGLIRPSAGTVTYFGEPVSGPNKRVGYVTQRDLLLPWRRVRENIRLPLELRSVPRAERERRVAEVIELVGLSGFENSYPSQLSGGMLKRAALARTLAYQPDTYLMDEPFASLDAQLRIEMHDELMRIASLTKATIVFVTHDLGEAITLSDRIVVVSRRPAAIKHIAEVDLPRPRKAAVAQSSPEFTRLFQLLWNQLDHVRHDSAAAGAAAAQPR